ncbi:hypothetical protein DIPPA_03416 [Diplonema papillatum]|nr:hypothetical protein DIPPA_03416 [Diplonema papillatum]
MQVVEAYRHVAAKVIAKQLAINGELDELLSAPDDVEDPVLSVIQAACLLTRTEVPNSKEAAVLVLRQLCESPLLLKRLAELEELALPVATLSQLGEYVSRSEFVSPKLSPPMVALAECLQKLYQFQCTSATSLTDRAAKDPAPWVPVL